MFVMTPGIESSKQLLLLLSMLLLSLVGVMVKL